jgi:hypothetical protein
VTPGAVTYELVDVDAGYDPAELAAITPGLQAQLREDVAPEWGTSDADVVQLGVSDPDGVVVELHGKAPADKQDALAFHTRTPDGKRRIPVFRDLLDRCGVSLSRTLSHELCEDRVDPDLTECVELPDGRIAAKEICDQVEATSYQKNGTEVSNFNTRANFAPREDGQPERYDFLGLQSKPFEVLDGGYAQVMIDGEWKQLGAMRAYRQALCDLGLSRGARRAR